MELYRAPRDESVLSLRVQLRRETEPSVPSERGIKVMDGEDRGDAFEDDVSHRQTVNGPKSSTASALAVDSKCRANGCDASIDTYPRSRLSPRTSATRMAWTDAASARAARPP